MKRSWLIRHLHALDKRPTDLARHLGIPPARIYEIMDGKRNIQRVEKSHVASFLKLTIEQLDELIEAGDGPEVGIDHLDAPLPFQAPDGRTVPVISTVLSLRNRWSLHHMQRPRRPKSLHFSQWAFAIIVQDEMNAPVYHAGSRLLIEPRDTVRDGDDVLLCDHTVPIRTDAVGVLGHLKRHTATSWHLMQYRDMIERLYSKKDFQSAWRVVARYIPR